MKRETKENIDFYEFKKMRTFKPEYIKKIGTSNMKKTTGIDSSKLRNYKNDGVFTNEEIDRALSMLTK